MTMIAIFKNNPFEKEIRIDCNSIKMQTEKYGEICILPNFFNTIFDIKDNIIELKNDASIRKIKTYGSSIVNVKDNNITIIGNFKEVL